MTFLKNLWNMAKSPLSSKRGQFAVDPKALIITLVSLAIVGAIGLAILASVSSSFTGTAAGAIGNITQAIANFFQLTPVLGTIFIAILLLGAVGLVGYAVMRNR